MKAKKRSILLLALVCLTGITLVIGQPASVIGNDTASNQTVNITSWYPNETNINNTEGAVRTFNVTINQTVNVSWLINGTEVFNQSCVNISEYTNTSAVPGYGNVTAYAHNQNGSDTHTWWWTVTEDTTPPTVIDWTPTGTKESVKTDITATFSEAMNLVSLNNATIIVCNSSGSSVTGDITYDNNTNTTTFDPISELEYNETYHVTITTGVQDRAGNNISSNCSWNFTTRSDVLIVPVVIYGNVIYPNGEPVLNPEVTITNLNTNEQFTAKTVNNLNYYRLQTDSTHIHVGDTLRFNATADTIFIDTVVRDITEADIESGGFRQNVPDTPDLVITNCASSTSSWWANQNKFNVTYTVENRGSKYANASTTTIYIDDSPAFNDSIVELAPGESYTNTVGPFDPPRKSAWFRVCANSDGAVAEVIKSNNCMRAKLDLLPNLKCEVHYDYPFLCEFVGSQGKYRTSYGFKNIIGGTNANASNTTINITTMSVLFSIDITFEDDLNKGIISDGLRDKFKSEGVPLSRNARVTKEKENEWIITDKKDITFVVRKEDEELNIYIFPIIRKVQEREMLGCRDGVRPHGRLGPFLCVPNTTFVVRICADADHEVLEDDETDNCIEQVFNCSVSAWKPDLIIVKESISTKWINRTNRMFNITYTVANIGIADADASTTCVHGKNDPVPELAPGENYTNTVESFLLRGCKETINICADSKGVIDESNEENNCSSDGVGTPKLGIHPADTLYWIDPLNKTYKFRYHVYNDGYITSNVSRVYVYIDGDLAGVYNQSPVSPGPYYVVNTIGPFNMTGESDTIKLCIEWDGGRHCHWQDNTTYRWGGCLSHDNKTLYNAYKPHIKKSCTFTGDIYAYLGAGSGTTSKGLSIGKSDIIIDGNGSTLIGKRHPDYGYWMDNPTFTGISNGCPGCRGGGYKNVTIKNLEIREFHIGISTGNTENVTIENCTIHDNGATSQYNYGITVGNSNHVKIDNCSVYNNTGILTDTNVAGGHGINFDDGCDYCAVTNSHIFHNYLSGILASPKCKYLDITNNLIEENGYCNESGFCAGVNLHWKGGRRPTNSTVVNNTILNNTGPGIYVTQSYTSIKNNTVKGSKNGKDVTGNGILVDGGDFTFMYNNTCCENGGKDIVNTGSSTATFGDDNTCDTTENYDDEATIGCNFYCGGENGVCVGATKNFRCGDVVTESCTFNRSMSCRVCADEYGLIVDADDITINGTGYALTGNFSGIGIFSRHSGVTIKNLQVEDFFTGMKIENTSRNLIENCTVRTNLLTGVNFSADNGTVRNSRIYDNVGPGIFIGGRNNVFENNIVARNKGYGIYFSSYAKGNNITANAVGDNNATDIYNDDGETNVGDNNTCDTAYNYWDTGMTDYNCTYAWTTPDLIISNKFEEWVDEEKAIYNVTYTIENLGVPESRPAGPSTTYLKILDVYTANNPVGLLKPGENYTSTFGCTPTIPEERDKDRIKVCADGADVVRENNPADIFCYKNNEWYSVEENLEDNEANNCRDNEWSKSGSAGTDIPGWDENAVCDAGGNVVYRCGEEVYQSCEFTGNMECPTGHGLRVGRSGITIDGKGFAIGRDEPASTCAGVSESYPGGGDCGIYNNGYDDAKIINLEILHFCNGIGLNYVAGNEIENCKIHHNGYGHGIHMVGVKDTTIRKNDIHHNRGTGVDCGGSGNGIFLRAQSGISTNIVIDDNDLHDNDRGGFWTKVGMHDCTIKYNRIWGNSVGSGLGDMTGGLVLRCIKSDHNKIENNEVWDNYGRGMYIGGNDNTISNNNVHDNKGDGINMGRSDGGSMRNHLHDNTVCDNEDMDIWTCGDDYENDGDNNFCDTTKDYADKNAQGGSKCVNPCLNVSKPDLKITDKFETWDDEGKSYKVTYTVQNVGKANAGASTTRIQIVNGVSMDDSVPALEQDEIYTSDTIGPFTMSGDSDTITVCADYEWRVEKRGLGSRDNNCMENTWWALPDLIVTKISLPDRLTFGMSNPITATIKNAGTVKTNGTFTVALFIVPSAVPIDTAPAPSELTAGRDTTVKLSWAPPAPGSYTLRVVADWVSDKHEGEIHESNEDNNEKTKTITEELGIEMPEGPIKGGGGGGGGGTTNKENIYGPGVATGEISTGEATKEVPINETKQVKEEKKMGTGHPFGEGGLIETVKVVAPMFLVVALITIVVVLFYLGYQKEKKMYKRGDKRIR